MSVVIEDPVAERVSKWLGSLPSGWAGARLLQVAEAWTSNVDKHAVEGQTPVRLCNYVDVYKNQSIVESIDFMAATAMREQIKKFRIRAGDTLITKDSETADDIGVPAFVEYEADDLICGYHLAIVRPDQRRILPRFLYWTLDSEPIARQWGVTAAGVTRVGIRSTDLNKVTIPLPPLDEQRAIADYLDQETAQIDALVAKQEEFIGLLRERRGAVQDRLLLSSDAPLVPLRHITEQITVGIVVQPAQWYVDEGILALRGTNIKPERIDLADLVYLSNEGHARHFKSHLRAGDVVVVRTGQSGTAAVVPPELSGSNAIDLLLVRPNRRLIGEYLAMVLNAPGMREISNQEIVGTIQGHLNVAALRGLNIPVPEISDQRALVSEWRSASINIDALIAKAEEHIDLAKERRSALITAAVTGQFDVRTAKKGARV